MEFFKMSLMIAWVVLVLSVSSTVGLKRCYECRSRGNLGDCGDPFNANTSSLTSGVKITTCVSGWCAKIIDGTEETIKRTERLCIQSPPSDNEERCGETNWDTKKVEMCFCEGDLCNNSRKNCFNLVNLILFIFIFLRLSVLMG